MTATARAYVTEQLVISGREHECVVCAGPILKGEYTYCRGVVVDDRVARIDFWHTGACDAERRLGD